MNLHTDANQACRAKAPSCPAHMIGGEGVAAWSELPALSLDEHGVIQECNQEIEELFGFSQSDLIYQHFSMLFPQLTGVEIIHAGQINPLLNYLCRCGHLFLTQNRQGEIFSSNLSMAHIGYDGSRLVRLLVRPCGG